MRSKSIYIIAGSNGVGKTIFARRFLPDYVKCPNFVNADLIAQGLSPFKPGTAALKAGKIVLQQIREFSNQGLDFGFETTLSGKSYIKLFKELKAKNYELHLFFLWIPSPELALARIKARVLEGGHNVAEIDVRRRFNRSTLNFFGLYKSLVTSWMIFDNSGLKPELIAKGKNRNLEIINNELFATIQKQVR